MRTITLFFASAIVLSTMMFTSCGMAGSKGDADSDSIIQQRRADSLANIPLPVEPKASAAELEYEITVFDSINSGQLDNILDLYEKAPGIMTFRGGPKRDGRVFTGSVKGTPSKVERVWTFKTEFDTKQTVMGSWGGGTGWTAQPVYVHWPKDVYDKQKQTAKNLTADFGEEEIMVGSLCSNVYFINYQSGKASREPLYIGDPVKGSMCLDPSLNGNLYIGEGVPRDEPTSQLCANIFSHSVNFKSGHDSKAWVSWSGNDSSPIRVGQFLFFPSENGTIYKYLIKDGTMVKHSTLQYKAKGERAAGHENSMCVYKNYGIVGNNHGDIICFDLNTLKPIWHYDNHDDIDGSIVCEVEGDTPYIYCGCEVDQQGNNGICHFIKLNALNGELVWENKMECRKLNLTRNHFDGGLYCTPLLGSGDCKDLLFASICQQGTSSHANFIAFSKKTGEIVYQKPMHQFAWSSPVGFLNENGKLFIFAGDSSGYGYLFDGKTGEQLFCERLVNNFESSPIVRDNYMVVGSRGTEICKFVVK